VLRRQMEDGGGAGLEWVRDATLCELFEVGYKEVTGALAEVGWGDVLFNSYLRFFSSFYGHTPSTVSCQLSVVSCQLSVVSC
jgi:hypothetical protein